MDIATIITLVGFGLQLYGAKKSAENQEEQSQFQKDQLIAQKEADEFRAAVSEERAQEALELGQIEVAKTRTRGKQFIGNQRAILAGSGVEVNTGTSVDLQADAAAVVEADALQIRKNTRKIIKDYNTEAALFRAGAKNADIASQRINPKSYHDAAFLQGLGSAGLQYANYLRS
jgi:hypothetical protein